MGATCDKNTGSHRSLSAPPGSSRCLQSSREKVHSRFPSFQRLSVVTLCETALCKIVRAFSHVTWEETRVHGFLLPEFGIGGFYNGSACINTIRWEKGDKI